MFIISTVAIVDDDEYTSLKTVEMQYVCLFPSILTNYLRIGDANILTCNALFPEKEKKMLPCQQEGV